MRSAKSAVDQTFRARLDELEQDARAAARFLYAVATIDHLRNRRPTLSAALDAHAGFWDTVLGALQTAAIAATVRLYDRAAGVASAVRALDAAEMHAQGLGVAMSGADPASPSGRAQLAALRASLQEQLALYERSVKSVRHELCTETGRSAMLETAALFQVVAKSDFDQLLLFALRLRAELSAWFERRPMHAHEPSIDVAQMLRTPIRPAQESPWEQRFVVQEVARFMLELEQSGMHERKRPGRERGED